MTHSYQLGVVKCGGWYVVDDQGNCIPWDMALIGLASVYTEDV